MRRIIHNSTAIAACLTLLVPQIAAAEQRVPDEPATRQGNDRAMAMPELAALLAMEVEQGLTVDDLLCVSGDPRPCADGVALMTPGGISVQVAESGMLFLAPEDQQMSMAPTPVDEPMVMDEQQAEQVAESDTAEAAAEAETAPEPAVEPEPEVIADPDPQSEISVEVEPLQAEVQEAAPEQAAEAGQQANSQQEDGQQQEMTQAEGEQADTETEDALAAALAAASEETDPAPAESSATTEVQPAPEMLRLDDNEGARERMNAMPGLSTLLRKEIEAGLTIEMLQCQDGNAYPCADGVALMTPKGVAVAVNQNNGQVTILPIQRQTNTVTANGEVVPRAPEADTVETAASKEAAQEAEASTAAALDAGDGQGTIVAEQAVTTENIRSSADDFEASLRSALEQAAGVASGTAPAQQANAAVSRDDDDNDLAKALILGLGAIAAGQMLSNNRQVALSTPDRVVVQRQDGSQEVIKDEVALLRQPGSTVTTENFDDGSSRTIVTREDGSKVVTIRDANLRVLRRTLISADGRSTMLIDDTADVKPVDVGALPEPAPVQTTSGTLSEEELRAALQREVNIDRRFTLGQIRNIPEVRALVAPVNIDAITFDTGSAAIRPDQARQLATLGRVIQDAVARNPGEVFMIEGHTDTVGSDAMNLALSDRRAESVALALTEYFDVPPENMVVQGYGEQFLKVRAEGDIRQNRRASVRRITDLLRTAQAN